MSAGDVSKRAVRCSAVAILLALGVVITVGGNKATAYGPNYNYCQYDYGCHVYSIGYYQANGLEGAEGQWHDNYLALAGTEYGSDYTNGPYTPYIGYPSHINNEMWLLTDSTGSSWVETGLMANFEPSAPWNPNGCNCVAYEIFWADANNGKFYFHTIYNITPDGNNHQYQITEQGLSGQSTYWNIYIDGILAGTSTIQTSTVAYNQQAGIELEEYANDFCLPGTNSCAVPDDDNEVGGASGEPDSEPDFDADRADTFNNYLQAYVNGGWEYWPSMQTVVNAGCNAFAEGFCLNGSEVQTYEWADNKPT